MTPDADCVQEFHRSSLCEPLSSGVEVGSSEGKEKTECVGGLELSPSKRSFWRKYRGLLLSINASLFFSLTAVVIKNLDAYHPFSISVWRHVAILLPTLPVLLFYHLHPCTSPKQNGTNVFQSVFPMNTRDRGLLFVMLILRGVIGATALLLQVWSLKYLSVGDASIFTFSAPVFVVLFAYCCLGEKCGVVSLLVILFTLCGVLVIVRPPSLTGQASYDLENLKGVGLGVSSVLLNSMVIVILRKLREVHWAFILFVFGLLGVAENLAVALAVGVFSFPVGLTSCLLTYAALPTTVYSAQISLILALKYENAGPVALVGASGVVFSFLFQLAFFGVPPDTYSLIGATIVILGVVITTARKWLAELPDHDYRKNRFGFLLR